MNCCGLLFITYELMIIVIDCLRIVAHRCQLLTDPAESFLIPWRLLWIIVNYCELPLVTHELLRIVVDHL